MKWSPVGAIAVVLIIMPATATPTYADNDGDTETGPTGIEGISASSDGTEIVVTVELDDLSNTQANTGYWWTFQTDGYLQTSFDCKAWGTGSSLAYNCAQTTPMIKDNPLAPVYDEYYDAPRPWPLSILAVHNLVPQPAERDDNPDVSFDTITGEWEMTITYASVGASSGDQFLLNLGATYDNCTSTDPYATCDNADVHRLHQWITLA